MKSSRLFKVIALFLVLVFIFSLTACGNTNSSNNSASAAQTQASSVQNGSTANAATVDPTAKYDPEITVTIGGSVSTQTKYPEGDSIENNIWTRTVKDELGINVKYAFIVSDTQYSEKVNVTIASGDIPDIMKVNYDQLTKLLDADLINRDISTVFDQYASPAFKSFYDAPGGKEWLRACSYEGKLAAIPLADDFIDEQTMFPWIRTDWLKKLGLSMPKTMNDLFAIMDAFVKNDPDGNRRNDTFGLGASKDIMSQYYGLKGFFNAYHAYPKSWVKDSSGKLAYGTFQPEMKPALAKLQELYKMGYIDKEFAVKDYNKENELMVSGKLGAMYGPFSMVFYFQKLKEKDPNSDWNVLPLLSIDDKPALAGVAISTASNVIVFRKGFEHPEAFIKMTNNFLEKGYGPNSTSDDFIKYVQDSTNGYIKWQYAIWCMLPPGKNHTIYEALRDEKYDQLNPEGKNIYQLVNKYKAGDVSSYWIYKAFEPKVGPFEVLLSDVIPNHKYYINGFYGITTELMKEKMPLINKIEDEMILNMIMGTVSVDKFDQYIKQANDAGLTEVTAEVNAWAAKH